MASDLLLRRKLTLRAHGRQVVLVKKSVERLEHVLMKAFLWALYLPDYPALQIEVPIGDRYKPDVVQQDALGTPVFWGEAGKVSRDKIVSLVRRYRSTHFALAKWATRLDATEQIVRDAAARYPREAPFDLISFPPDSATRFVDSRGHLNPSLDAVRWVRIG